MDYGAKVRGRKGEGEFRSVPIPFMDTSGSFLPYRQVYT